MTSTTLAAKRALGKVLGPFTRQEARDVVLLYHSVAGGALSTPLASFESQMRWLDRHARIIPLHHMLDSSNPGHLRVAITFDDGYATLHQHALRVLAPLGASATVFLTSGMIEPDTQAPSRPEEGHYPDERFLSWAQVLELRDQGWSIACHGWRHLDSTLLRADEFVQNILQCRSTITSHTGTEPRWLAYTWGHFHESHTPTAMQLGMTHVFTCLHGPARPPRQEGPGAIDRIDIRPDLTLADFSAVVRGDWDYLGWLQRARHRRRARHA